MNFQKLKDENLREKNVLLYLGKFPGYGFDVDGGSMMARQLIDTLKNKCKLTVSFIRKNEEIFFDENVDEIHYVKYIDPYNNKFLRRMQNLSSNREAIGNYEKYDIIIAAHISKLFGFENYSRSFWAKTILFPMFCSKSYIRAGETVPEEYIKMEQFVIDNVSKIITPSLEEKNDIITNYGCDEKKITVIPRGVSPLIKYKHREKVSQTLKIICIGTVKKQKNTKENLKLLSKLAEKGISCELHLVCTIQDEASRKTFSEFCEMAEKMNLREMVKIHISISQNELAKLFETMDINVSMSTWETFGRGIFEGASAGLPTFVFDKLETVKRLSDGNRGFFFASDIDEMAAEIQRVISGDCEIYSKMSEALSETANEFSSSNEKKRITETILAM